MNTATWHPANEPPPQAEYLRHSDNVIVRLQRPDGSDYNQVCHYYYVPPEGCDHPGWGFDLWTGVRVIAWTEFPEFTGVVS